MNDLEFESLKKIINESDILNCSQRDILIEKIYQFKIENGCFERDLQRSIEALIQLSKDLSDRGFRQLDKSSCKAAVKAIDLLLEKNQNSNQKGVRYAS